MKPKSPTRDDHIRVWTSPIRYCWSTPDGTVHHGQSVVVSPDRRGLRAAAKNFFRQFTHVDPEVS